MIKCPNCGQMNIDGTLLCEGCVWDLIEEPRYEDTPEGKAAGAAVPATGSAPAAAMSGSFDVIPMAEEFAPLAESVSTIPAAAPAASAKATQITPQAQPTTLRPSEEMDDYPPAPPPGTTSLRPATGMPSPAAPVSQVRPPTAVQPPPRMSSVRPPTAVQPPRPLAPRVSTLAPEERPKLVVVTGQKTNAEYLVYDGENFIGRSDDKPVDIDLGDQEPTDKIRCSRQHACIYYENGTMFVQDMSSANGTFVNRTRLNANEKRQLRSGDYIQTGSVLFQVKY